MPDDARTTDPTIKIEDDASSAPYSMTVAERTITSRDFDIAGALRNFRKMRFAGRTKGHYKRRRRSCRAGRRAVKQRHRRVKQALRRSQRGKTLIVRSDSSVDKKQSRKQ